MQVTVSKRLPLIIIATVSLITVGLIVLMATSNQTNTITSAPVVAALETVSVNAFADEVTESDAIILDVRTPEEFAEGHLPGALNIDFYEQTFPDEISKLDKDSNYKIYCNSGNRSGTTLDLMRQFGFTNVTELDGGIQAWLGSGNSTCTSC